LKWYCLRIRQGILGTGGRHAWRASPLQSGTPLAVRLGRTADLRVFEQIFIWEEYSCLRDLTDIGLVLDLGANVGFSAVYFLNAFPQARVVAVEPDEKNAAICRENVAPYASRATVLHGAAWSECTRVRLSDQHSGEGKEWARQVEQPEDDRAGEIQAWDVGTLIDRTGAEKIDLLKVDIEGGEIVVFSHSAREWLPRVRNICVELHGKECREAFSSALSNFDYDLSHSGELTICRNLRFRG
jgi:FkbM family methyltransferase